MTPAEQHHRDLLEERYGPLEALEAERAGPTPASRRRARRSLQKAAEHLARTSQKGST